MENPLLRKVEPVIQVPSNRYASLGLRDNPFPLEPGLSPSSGDPRINGSIYSEALFKDKQSQFERLLIPGKNGAQSIVFLMDHATRRGRGIGKSAFLRHQCNTIMADFGDQASGGKGMLFALHVMPSPQCRKFWEFCRTLTETMIDEDIIAKAMWRLRALSGGIPEEVLQNIGEAQDWPDTIGDDKWLQSHNVDVLFTLPRVVRGKLLAAGVTTDIAEILARTSDSRALGAQLLSILKDSRWRREGGRIVFHDFVNLFEAAGFTRGLFLIDEVEKIVYYQNIGERRAFVESLRYCLFDADFANARNRFFGILLTIHPGIQEILLSHWQAAGLDRFAPLAEPHAQENTIYFPPLNKKMALPLVKVYLDYYRTSESPKDKIDPFTEIALTEALVKSGGVPGLMLRLLHRVVENAIESGATRITKELVEKVHSPPERVEPGEVGGEEIPPSTQVELTEEQ